MATPFVDVPLTFPLAALATTYPWEAWAEYRTGRDWATCQSDPYLSGLVLGVRDAHSVRDPDRGTPAYVAQECEAWWGDPVDRSRVSSWRDREAYWLASGFPETSVRRPWRALSICHDWQAGRALDWIAERVDLTPAATRAILRRLAVTRDWARVCPLTRPV